MDTKLKNSHKIRIILSVLAILLVTIGNFLVFPFIAGKGEEAYENLKQEQEIDESLISELILGSAEIYYENMLGGIPEDDDSAITFGAYADYVDYAGKTGEWEAYSIYYHTKDNIVTEELSTLLKEDVSEKQLVKLQELYQMYFVLKYDEEGNLSIGRLWETRGREKELKKKILKYAGEYRERFWNNTEEVDSDIAPLGENIVDFPRNFQIALGIAKESYVKMEIEGLDSYWRRASVYAEQGGSLLYIGTLVALFLAVLFFTSNKIWKNTIDFRRKGILYLAEAAILGVICIFAMHDYFIGTIVYYTSEFGIQSPVLAIQNGGIPALTTILEMLVSTMLIYVGWYVSILLICPVFPLGFREYFHQYSFVCLIFRKSMESCKRFFQKIKEEIQAIDFSQKTMKTIRKILLLNFIVLSVVSFFWFFGIIILFLYSVLLFFFIKKQYIKMERDYQSLKKATAHMAAGDLQYEDSLSWGVFEPLKGELWQIRNGFSRAVEEEVKSQRMKTELITNVSHDLKTPLTAITTYVELLKDSQITEEQRQSYIEVLEKKSLRLKVLVEDLFEVSKADSNTIKLDFMEVNVVNLLKQVCVEHEEKFLDMGLWVKWEIPEEKVVLLLDNQKTYRIFENLFINIEKYAMPGSRVFIEVHTENGVEIILKNISAQELENTGEEVMERFVRGDTSRNTEGSGLGLAIAKSFTEAQKGKFSVMVDGDLFKVTISWQDEK